MPEEVAYMRCSLRSEKYQLCRSRAVPPFSHVPLSYEPPFHAEELYEHSIEHPSKQPHKPVGSAWMGKEELVNLATSCPTWTCWRSDADLVKFMLRVEYKHLLPSDGRWKEDGTRNKRRKGNGERKGSGNGKRGRRRKGMQGGGSGAPKRTSKTSILRENFQTNWANA